MARISVITINLNNALGLDRTIASVVSQSYTDYEYIVVDGASTDESKDVIECNGNDINNWVSESDDGIYDAMNKGIRMSHGEYLLFLNSGDTLYSEDSLTLAALNFNGKTEIYYGNLVFKEKDKETLFEYPEKLKFSFVYKNSLPHPASFIKRELFGANNLYNEKLKLVSDWEFFMKAIFIKNASYKHIDLIISNFDTGGFSNDPKYKEQMEKERGIVMKADFPLLYNDMLELESQRKLLDRKDIKMLLQLQLSKTGKKIHLKVLKWLLKFFTPASNKEGNKTKDSA
jgi:glycosyltransferase involved in cell wall biosynthesis